MDIQTKLNMVKSKLHILLTDTSLDAELLINLDIAGTEILNWVYTNKPDKRSTVTEVPLKYEITQVMAVVNGYSHEGAEGETVHNENGINRTFKYDDMIAYIRANTFQLI